MFHMFSSQFFNFMRYIKLQWTKPPEGDPAAAHAARAPAPPLPLGGGGLVYGSKRNGGQPDWAWGWAPHRGFGLGLKLVV
jgi:hypothetical protein